MAFTTNLLLTVMFLCCTFNVQATEYTLAKTTDTLALGDHDPEIGKCFQPIQEALMKMQKELEDNNKEPSEATIMEVTEQIDDVLTCIKAVKSLPSNQIKAIEKLQETKEEFKAKSEGLKECVQDAGDVGEKKIEEMCKEEAAAMNKSMQALLRRMMSFMLEFIKDESLKRTQIYFAVFGLAVKEELEEITKFLVNVILFTFKPAIDVVKGIYKAFTSFCANPVGILNDMYQCMINNVWPKDNGEWEHDGDKYYDPDQEWEFYINDKYYKIDGSLARETVLSELVLIDSNGDTINNGESYVMTQLLANKIVESIISRLPSSERAATKEEIRDALMGEYDHLLEAGVGEKNAKAAINYALHTNYHRSHKGRDASDIMENLTDAPLALVDQGFFHHSEMYKEGREKMDKNLDKSMKELNEELAKGDIPKDVRNVLEEVQKMYGEGKDMEGMVNAMRKKMKGGL